MNNKEIILAVVLTASVCLNLVLGFAVIGYAEMLDEQEDLVIQWCEYSNELIDFINLYNSYSEFNLDDLTNLECWA